MLSESFSANEFACKCGCGLATLHPGFISSLQALRDEFGMPMTVTSGARCKAHNDAVGGHPRSLHICDEPVHAGQKGCLAVDISTPNGQYRGRLFTLAWRYGFSVGWNAKRGFLHLDRRDYVGLAQNSFDY